MTERCRVEEETRAYYDEMDKAEAAAYREMREAREKATGWQGLPVTKRTIALLKDYIDEMKRCDKVEYQHLNDLITIYHKIVSIFGEHARLADQHDTFDRLNAQLQLCVYMLPREYIAYFLADEEKRLGEFSDAFVETYNIACAEDYDAC